MTQQEVDRAIVLISVSEQKPESVVRLELLSEAITARQAVQ